MRKSTCFNQNWLYAAEQISFDSPDEFFEPITLPHSNKIFPHHNFDNQEYQFISTYRKCFTYEPQAEPVLVFLDFDGVMLACTVYLNGIKVAEHLGGYTPFSVEITSAIRPGENLLTVYVDSQERKDIPPYGHLVDYLTFGGIYRDVHMRIVPQTFIENIFVKTSHILTDPQVLCEVRLNRMRPGLMLQAILLDQKGEKIATAQTSAEGKTTIIKFTSLSDIQLWSLGHPHLYTIEGSIIKENELIDTLSSCFGFRTAEFHQDGSFYLNGEQVKLFGLNRHQTYPYIGAAAPARMQRMDADILKSELGCNIVRTSHYPQSPHFLDRCDEIGLLVFEEIPGWQHIGDEDWQQITIDELKAMIERDRNHPAIILWGVRINESADNDAFYIRTNTLAHHLDPTRQTGGVRNFQGSAFLEDVYTYNDFSNNVVEADEQPHLITEFAGHMFPTKIWDHEERLIEHALLHARIQDLQMGRPDIVGAIGWCAFDYATHIEFGSGDRICYHGVMDIFRIPKWAAHFYMSQQSPTQQVVLQAATYWTMGDRSGGGNNPLTVFSNCDKVEVIIGQHNLGRFLPDRKNFPYLPHPPFTIPIEEKFTAWGGAGTHDLHLVGYIANEPVVEQWIASNQLPSKLVLSVDTHQLIADGADMTRLCFRITDVYGNTLPYTPAAVHFDLDGPADLIGENPFPLMGGQAAVFLKARHQTGTVKVHARANGMPGESISLEIMQ